MDSLFPQPPLRGARKILFLLALTGSLGGLQGVFCVQMAMGSPYLISLGFSKPLMPFVWIAGPLAGFLGQPYFGLLSDHCRNPWGKRKPFIAGGALVMIFSLLALAWAGDIVRSVLWIFGLGRHILIQQTMTMIAAAIFVWILNFAIQPLQCGLRALILESCPPEQIDTANAWASRMISIGSLLGYGSGFVDISRVMPFEGGHPRFKALCVLATCGLALTVCVCCSTIKERDPTEHEPPSVEFKGMCSKFKHIYSSISRMPPEVIMICKVQLCSWIGWFSFMYYITTYVSEIYLKNVISVDVAKAQVNANRLGSLAMLMFALAQLLTSVIAPSLFTTSKLRLPDPTVMKTTALSRFILRQLYTPVSSLCTFWMLSQTIFATCMFSTLLVDDVVGVTILVGFVGISGALSQIVPFNLIGLILQRYQILYDGSGPVEAIAENITRYEIRPGIVMGIHNMAIAAPQLIAAVGSSAIFWLLGSPDGGDRSRSTGWVLRAGGVAALAAMWMTLRMRNEIEDVNDVFEAQIERNEQSYTLLHNEMSELDVGMDL